MLSVPLFGRWPVGGGVQQLLQISGSIGPSQTLGRARACARSQGGRGGGRGAVPAIAATLVRQFGGIGVVGTRQVAPDDVQRSAGSTGFTACK